MKFENTKVFNFEGALRGMRNPKNSWNLSDSFFGLTDMETSEADYMIAKKWVQKDYPTYPMEENLEAEKLYETVDDWLLANGVLERDEYNSVANCAFIGPNDMRLAQTLIKSGPEHRKFLRQIFVCVDITAPLYYLKEFDTYKVGTVANSTSTMHKLTSKPITIDCFEIDDWEMKYSQNFITDYLIPYLEKLRQKFIETKDVHYWKELVRWLPESWSQTRTVTLNYENILTIYFQRRYHKLTEWHSFCKWCESLPYFKEFILILDKNS